MLCGRTRSMTWNFTATDTLGLPGDSPVIIKAQHHPQGLADVCWRSAGTKNLEMRSIVAVLRSGTEQTAPIIWKA